MEPAPTSAPYIDFDAQKTVTLNFLALRMGSSVFPTQGVNFGEGVKDGIRTLDRMVIVTILL